MFNEQHRKEKPIISLLGLGGGAGSKLFGAAALPFGESSIYKISGTYEEFGYVASIFPDNSDTSGQTVYVTAIDNSTANTRLYKCDLDPTSPSITWQKDLGGTATYGHNTNIALDASGNVYVATSCSTGALLLKFNSSGTLQWQRNLQESGVYYSGWNNVLYNPNDGYIYACGTRSGGGGGNALIAKYATDGTFQWAKHIGTGDSAGWQGISQDGAQMYLSGTIKDGPYYRNFAYYENDGSIGDQKQLGTGELRKIHFTQSPGSEITVVGDSLIMKFNGGYVTNWAVGPGAQFWHIDRDSSGAVYVGGFNNAYFQKRSGSDGSVTWQKDLGNFRCSDIRYAHGFVYIAGLETIGNSLMFGVFNSTTGGTNGTYGGSYPLTDSSLTSVTVSPTFSNTSYTNSGSSASEVAGPNTITTPTQTIALQS